MNESEHRTTSPAEPCDRGPSEAVYREPPLLRYLRLLWGRRGLLLGGSLLPALLVASILYLCPRKYDTTFVYERPLTESEYNVFLRRFYSQENLDKMIGRLREQGLPHYIEQLERAQRRQAFEDLIGFEVAPIYPKRLQTTDPCTSEKISGFKARLLSIKVTGDSPEEVAGASAVITGIIENVLPLYDVRNHLKDSLQKLREDAAKIEDDRFKLSLDRQKEQAKLEKLQALQSAPGEAAPGGVVLQFNVETAPSVYQIRAAGPKAAPAQEISGGSAEKYNFYEFLPLSYQIRAVQSKIIDLQETLANDTEKYNFYLQVLDLDGRLLAKIEESLLTYYTAQQYLGFLGEQLAACKDQSVADHLKSYLRKTENLVLVNIRAGEKPVVYPVPKGVLKNGALAFVVGLMLVLFTAVLLEHRRQQYTVPAAERGWRESAAQRSPGS